MILKHWPEYQQRHVSRMRSITFCRRALKSIIVTALILCPPRTTWAVQPYSATKLALSPTPIPEPTERPVFTRIDRTVEEICPEVLGKRSRAEADSADEISAWSVYVSAVATCGRRQRGITQARIYAEALSGILQSILYLRPDAYGSAAWRKNAAALLKVALPDAAGDPDLVAELRSLQSDLRRLFLRAATNEDVKPTIASVSLERLQLSGAFSAGRTRVGPNVTEMWFSVNGTLAAAEARLRRHLVSLGWYFCPPSNPKAWHDEIVVTYAGPTPTPDPHNSRRADASLLASLSNEWDLSALFFKGAGKTDVTLRTTEVYVAPLCVSPRHPALPK